MERPHLACAAQRRHFPVGASRTRQPLQPEAIGAVMEVTKCLKPSISVSRIGDSASVQAATLVNVEPHAARMRLRAFGAAIAGISSSIGGVARRRMIGIASKKNPHGQAEGTTRHYSRVDDTCARNDSPACRHWLLQKARSNGTACRAAAERRTT